MFHAESPEILDSENKIIEGKSKQLPYLKTQYNTFLSSRPASAEDVAIQTVINASSKKGNEIL
jgi:hypothetical protein